MEFLKFAPYTSPESQKLVDLLSEAFAGAFIDLRAYINSSLTYQNTTDYKVFKKDFIYELSYSVCYRNFILSKRVKAPNKGNTEVYYIPTDLLIHYCLVNGYAISPQSVEVWQDGAKGSFLALSGTNFDKLIQWHCNIEKTLTFGQIRSTQKGEYNLSDSLAIDEQLTVYYSHTNRGVLLIKKIKHNDYRGERTEEIRNFYPDNIINLFYA